MSRKTILISVISHIALFNIFTVSFGNRILKADYGAIAFLGQLLYNSQVIPAKNGVRTIFRSQNRVRKIVLTPFFLRNSDPISRSPELPALKPQGRFSFIPEASLRFTDGAVGERKPPHYSNKNEPAIILHPLLPYSFGLYFKDRQVAHVELEFKIASSEENNSIMIKRKISSGNLEVDLLTMRYIGHYLFIQQGKFSPDNWHTVKLDLSAKSD